MDNPEYYLNTRREIEPLLPDRLGAVLEVGCASGATLRWLKDAHGAARTVGLEINADLAEALARNVDTALIGSADQLAQAEAHGPYDLILFLDVLEHLVDPWTTLSAYARLLADDGRVIVSVPNIGHARIIVDLLRGRFRYARDGILDRTHLRFFVRETAVELMEQAGLKVDGMLKVMGPDRGLARLADRLTGGRVEDYLTGQFIMRAVPAARFGGAELRLRWWRSG